MNNPIWPEFDLVHDFMAVLFICKCEDDSIKRKGAILTFDRDWPTGLRDIQVECVDDGQPADH